MEGFNDLVEDVKKAGGPLLWITQKKHFTEYEAAAAGERDASSSSSSVKRRTPEQIKEQVLASDRLRHTVEQILSKNQVKNRTLKVEEIMGEARKMVDLMAHEFDLKYVRMLGYALMKIFCNIYEHIYYNADAESNLKIVRQYPVLFLPLHRSYMDFMIISLLCFNLNIQLPTIAGGEDFLGLSFMSTVLRRTGAFFIRRSFGSDELYWAVFTEYVQQHLKHADRPVEFFIEGTRSRTSKSLLPKQGMLSTCVELFLKGHRAQDIYCVPISLTYERLLEESLYANELLGIPKPKESVSGLIKARAILSQSYGSIFINVAKPISLREVLETHMSYSNSLSNQARFMNLTPAFIFELTGPQSKAIEASTYSLLIHMLRNQIIFPVSLISTCMLVSLDRRGRQRTGAHTFDCVRSIDLNDLCYQVEKMRRMLINMGVKVHWPVSTQTDDELGKIRNLVLDNIQLHENLFDLFVPEGGKMGTLQAVKQARTAPNLPYRLELKQTFSEKRNESSLFESASLYLSLSSYRNQLINLLVRVSFLGISLLSSSVAYLGEQANVESLMSDFNQTLALDTFRFLCRLFNREYIFAQQDTAKDYSDALKYTIHLNLIKSTRAGQLELDKFHLKQFLFLAKLAQSTLENYSQIYSIILDAGSDRLTFASEKDFVRSLQQDIFARMLNNNTGELHTNADFECLSLSLISNAILTLSQFDTLTRSTVDSAPKPTQIYKIDQAKLARLSQHLKYIIKLNRIKMKIILKACQDGSESSNDRMITDLGDDENEGDFSASSSFQVQELLTQYENYTRSKI